MDRTVIVTMNEFKRIAIHHPPGIAIWESILKGIFQFARPDFPWLFATNFSSDLDYLKELKPDGAIVQCTCDDEAILFRELGIPVVNVARERSQISFPSVQIDDVAVGQMAARYFMDKGFQNLATYSMGTRDFMNSRVEGFRKEASLHGHHVESFNIQEFVSGQYVSPPSPELMDWLRQLPKPTGLFATTDVLGLVVLAACRAAEIRTPEQVAVLGASNNEMLCHLDYPSLSSIRLPGERLGFEAARKLNSMLAGNLEPSEALRLLPVEVVNRQSTDIYCIDDDPVRQALDFIKNNFHLPINVASVVKEAEISRSGLERRFRTLLGRSILEVLTSQRIKSAKQMLAATNLPLQSIAEQTGFSSSRQFTTTFRKETGQPPSTYRERMTG